MATRKSARFPGSSIFIKTVIARPTFDVYGGRLMMVFSSTPAISWELMVKGLMDRVLSFVLLVLSAPLLLAAYIGIRLASPGPVVFKQQRGGKNGKPFTMYKLRTMGLDAEERKEELQEDNEMSGPVFRCRSAPASRSYAGAARSARSFRSRTSAAGAGRRGSYHPTGR